MGCCFSCKSATSDNNDENKRRSTSKECRTNDEVALKDLNTRLTALYDGHLPKRTSDAKRLSELAALEVRLDKLQQPLNSSIIGEDDDDESPGRRSIEVMQELEERLRALGSGSAPDPCDITTLVVPPKEQVKKKRISEEKHIENLSMRLDLLQIPLSGGR